MTEKNTGTDTCLTQPLPPQATRLKTKNTGTDTCLTQPLPPQPKRLRRELFFAQNLEVPVFSYLSCQFAELRSTHNPAISSAFVKVKEKDEFLFELGKYCYDLSKLVFGGVVLINVFHFEKDNVTEFIAGVSVMTGLFILGALLTKRGSKKV